MGLLARGQEPCCGGLPVSELAEAASFVKDKIKHTDAFISVRFRDFSVRCNSRIPAWALMWRFG